MRDTGTVRTEDRGRDRSAIRKILLSALMLVGVLAAVVGFPTSSGAVQPLLEDFGLSGPTITSEGGNTTFAWALTYSGSSDDTLDVSHVLIDTCLGDTAVSSNSNGYEDPDGHGDTGYKWEYSEAGAVFSITFPGDVPGGGTASAVIAKYGEHIRFSVGGPSCVTQPTTTTTTATTTTTSTSTTAPSTTTSTVATQVAGIVVQAPPTVAAQAAPAAAAPTQLAFTGSGDWELPMAIGGSAAFVLGLMLVVMSRRSPVGLRARR